MPFLSGDQGWDKKTAGRQGAPAPARSSRARALLRGESAIPPVSNDPEVGFGNRRTKRPAHVPRGGRPRTDAIRETGPTDAAPMLGAPYLDQILVIHRLCSSIIERHSPTNRDSPLTPRLTKRTSTTVDAERRL